jgi:alpha-amylase
MGVALVAWGRFFHDGAKVTVPAPSTDPGKPWLWDFLAKEAPALHRAGFTAVQAPPASKAQGGAGRGCDGYGVFDLRDIGSKPQQGSTPTRYGTTDSLRRMIACCHAVGIDVYLDVVLHQLIGENGGSGVFRYLGADGRTLNGRGAMQPGCFRGGTGNNDPIPPFSHPDAVPEPRFDFPFGREKVYQNCDPPDYTIRDAIDFGDWLFRTTDADGMRFDDVKGTWAPFVAEFMRAKAMASKFAYSEYFDGNPATLNWWATSPPMSSRSLVADFALHWALQAACDGGNVRGLNGSGYASRNPFLSCTFVDNPDTDTSPGQQVIANKLLAYAFILTTEGYPFIYGKDYFGSEVWPGAYGLKPWLDNLIWIHEQLAAGSTVTRYLDERVIVLNRTGDPGLLTALNFDTVNQRSIACATSFGPNVHLHDYTGRHPDIRTNAEGLASFTIPANSHQSGQSYLCFSRAGQGGPIAPRARSTSQTFFAADELDIPSLHNNSITIGRIYPEKGTPMSLSVKPTGPGWVSGATIEIDIVQSDGHVLGRQRVRHGATADSFTAIVESTEWHTLRATGTGLTGAVPCELAVTYHGPQQLAED